MDQDYLKSSGIESLVQKLLKDISEDRPQDPATYAADFFLKNVSQPLIEFSPVYTNRALNHMSEPFKVVMNDISRILKKVHGAKSVALIPGSGTFAMEAVARQYCTGKRCSVLRYGYWSYRWEQIFQQGSIPSTTTILKAQANSSNPPSFTPIPLDQIRAQLITDKPELLLATHVETSTGIVLPDEYIKGLASIAHEVGALFVLDCIASGTLWVNMEELGIDIIVSAPQKGWSSHPCCGIVLLGESARAQLDSAVSTSFACDLKKWITVMETYENGGFMYHTTMPTVAIRTFRNNILEAEKYGFEKAKNDIIELGAEVRQLLRDRSFVEVAQAGYESPTVVVFYTEDAGKMVAGFKKSGIQIAGGVPFMLDEPSGLQSFRLGLFGLDKLGENKSQTIELLKKALDGI